MFIDLHLKAIQQLSLDKKTDFFALLSDDIDILLSCN